MDAETRSYLDELFRKLIAVECQVDHLVFQVDHMRQDVYRIMGENGLHLETQYVGETGKAQA